MIILSGAHMVTHVFGRIHTALFPLFREEFQLSLPQLGILAALPQILQMSLYVPSGLLTDRLGQKTLIMVSFVSAGITAIVTSVTNTLPVFMLSLSILVASITFYHPPAYSLTSELFPPEVRGRALGIHGSGGTLGMALGPLSLSFFLGTLLWNWRTIYLFWALPILLYTILIWRLKHPSNTQKLLRKSDPEIDAKGSETQDGGIRSVFTFGVIGFMLYRATRGI